MTLLLIIVFSVLGSVGAVALAGSVLAFPEGTRRLFIPVLISYAIGTLLGAAFLGLLPHALERIHPSELFPTVLAGMVLFFVLEKLVIWHHCHDRECEVRRAAGPLLLMGDALHNFVDGVIITAAFLVSTPLGASTALAVIVHETPQEAGDFAILLDGGYSPKRAFAYNVLSSLATLVGALVAYFSLKHAMGLVPYVMGLAAASFIYIATAGLIPGLHQRTSPGSWGVQVALILAGVGTIALLQDLIH